MIVLFTLFNACSIYYGINQIRKSNSKCEISFYAVVIFWIVLSLIMLTIKYWNI